MTAAHEGVGKEMTDKDRLIENQKQLIDAQQKIIDALSKQLLLGNRPVTVPYPVYPMPSIPWYPTVPICPEFTHTITSTEDTGIDVTGDTFRVGFIRGEQ